MFGSSLVYVDDPVVVSEEEAGAKGRLAEFVAHGEVSLHCRIEQNSNRTLCSRWSHAELVHEVYQSLFLLGVSQLNLGIFVVFESHRDIAAYPL